MATIKAYTDLEQSKKLAEILPLKSADMCYLSDESLFPKINYNGMVFFNSNEEKPSTIIPCWSLAALLGVIPKHIKDYNVLRIDINEKDTAIWYDEIGCGINNELPDITKESVVDACVAIIEKLHELKMLRLWKITER